MLGITHGRTTGQCFRLMTHPIKGKAVHKQILKSFKAQDEFSFLKKKHFSEMGGKKNQLQEM